MQKAVEEKFDNADCVIMAAAVADYRAKNIAEHAQQNKVYYGDAETNSEGKCGPGQYPGRRCGKLYCHIGEQQEISSGY